MTRQEKLNEIALCLKNWIDFEQSHTPNIPVADDKHIIGPPVWPTVGTLKKWIEVLREKDVTAFNAGLAEGEQRGLERAAEIAERQFASDELIVRATGFDIATAIRAEIAGKGEKG